MPKIVGKVLSVTKAKNTVQLAHGTFARLTVTVEDKTTGENVKIQRLVKPDNDGQSLIGKNVAVTYTQKEMTTADGDTFTVNSADSKNFALLDANGEPVQGKFGGRPATSSATVTKQSAGYNSDGARHGMIVNNAVSLADHRGDNSLEGLMQAAADVMALTKFVEAGAVVSEPTKAPVKPAKRVVEEDSPFDDE